MTTITRHVRDISAADRSALEHMLGMPLRDDQSVLFQIAAPALRSTVENSALPELPEYLNVYQGLTDEEIDAIESAILQRDQTSRSIE